MNRSLRAGRGGARPWPWIAFAGCLAACRAPDVFFQGRAATAAVSIENVREAPELPNGAVRLGRVVASCDGLGEWRSFRDRSLVDVDCTEARLRRMLREAASRVGGDVLVGVECEGNSDRSCRAALGRTTLATRARAPRRSFLSDIRGERGGDVRVDFSTKSPDPKRQARDEHNVADIAVIPPSHHLVGSFATACEECSELETRDALRIAAGRLGVSDVVGVRCVAWGTGFRCAGSAAIAEVAP